MINKQAWRRVALGVGLIGCLLAFGKAIPLPGLDLQAVSAVANCNYGSGGILPIYDCLTWPTVLTAPLSIGIAPLILPLVLVVYLMLWARQRISRR